MNKTDLLNLLSCNDVYVFGCGELGRAFMSCYEYADKVKAVFDDYADSDCIVVGDVENSANIKLPVYSPKTKHGLSYIKTLNPETTVVIIASASYVPIRDELLSLGLRKIYWLWNFRDFIRGDSVKEIVVPREKQIVDYDSVKKLKSILSDNESKRIIDKIVEYRNAHEGDYTSIISRNPQYFEKDLLNFNDREIIIDAGAFVGDTIENALKYLGGFQAVYAFEPDRKNYALLTEYCQTMPNVHCYNYGVGDTDNKVKFSSTGSGGAHISNEGEVVVTIGKIDSLNVAATFIKMDVEGYEIPALYGARQTIEKFKPKLAISVYHKGSDLWEIPLLIKSWVPEYKMYIRHHSANLCDTVLYATC